MCRLSFPESIELRLVLYEITDELKVLRLQSFTQKHADDVSNVFGNLTRAAQTIRVLRIYLIRRVGKSRRAAVLIRSSLMGMRTTSIRIRELPEDSRALTNLVPQIKKLAPIGASG